MKIVVGSDERTPLTDAVVRELRERGHEVEMLLPDPGATLPWAEVGAWVGWKVARGEAEQGVLFCWTGTGVSMAANKVPGVRAALCGDPETARGARRWNDANVLVMSLRATAEPVAKEILDAWFSTPPSDQPEDRANIAKLEEIAQSPSLA
ncbi:MAG: RpiB/LacA/LacB family sugar-phosphate isomerase [Chloroflexota bacterium]|nr:RpiB/LacA/LacB family sugar-phosphate isomerase [Dehalococcoidia bacterium]MDW8253658.1 RpiB/LacA/LacB family sugar-phosphate isomerase [Chloroflexota bacterium]